MKIPITFEAVGVVRSPINDADDCSDWSDVISEIHVDDALLAGLTGIEDHVDIVVVYFLHKFTFNPATDLQPTTCSSSEQNPVGIFACRSNRRPNAIGSTTVELVNVAGNVLRVKGLDALDGSPVLDIKPYQPPISTPRLDDVPLDKTSRYP